MLTKKIHARVSIVDDDINLVMMKQTRFLSIYVYELTIRLTNVPKLNDYNKKFFLRRFKKSL